MIKRQIHPQYSSAQDLISDSRISSKQQICQDSTVDMTGKTCLITDRNSGIGEATALGLARMRATVVTVSRDKERGEAAHAEIIAKSGNRNIGLMWLTCPLRNPFAG